MLNPFPFFYPVNLQYSTYKHIFSSGVENSVDSNQLASESTLFSKEDKSGFSRTRFYNVVCI